MAENMAMMERTADGEMEIDLLDLLQSWRKYLVQTILVVILGGAIGFLVTMFLITPVYEATSSMYVVSASANSAFDLSDLNFGTSLTNDYAQLVKSRTMMERVLADTNEPLTVKQLENMVDVYNQTGTRILVFTVSSTDPEQATAVANSFVEQAIRFLPEVMGVKDNIPTAVDLAILPEQASNIKYVRNTLIGALAGFAIVAAVVVISYLVNDTFNSADDIEKYLGVVPMAVVPENGQKHRGNGYYYYYYTNARPAGGKRGRGA